MLFNDNESNIGNDRPLASSVDPAFAQIVALRILGAKDFISHAAASDDVFAGFVDSTPCLVTGPGELKDNLSSAEYLQVYVQGIKRVVEVDHNTPMHMKVFQPDVLGTLHETMGPADFEVVSLAIDNVGATWRSAERSTPQLVIMENGDIADPAEKSRPTVLGWLGKIIIQ